MARQGRSVLCKGRDRLWCAPARPVHRRSLRRIGLWPRHCERSEAIQGGYRLLWIAASPPAPRNDDRELGRQWRASISEQAVTALDRSEEHTSELQSLMRISYAVLCLKKKQQKKYYA